MCSVPKFIFSFFKFLMSQSHCPVYYMRVPHLNVCSLFVNIMYCVILQDVIVEALANDDVTANTACSIR